MRNAELASMRVFLKVVEHESFVRAAADLGLSPPAASQSVRSLEKRLRVQLLRRTTRTVTPTAEGERLAGRLASVLGDLDLALDEASGADRGGVRGTVRLSVPRLAAQMCVAQWLGPFAAAHPNVLLEVSVNEALIDLASARFDAGIRLHERLAPGMTAIPLGSPLRTAVVGSPAYFAAHGTPSSPRELVRHRCIAHRLPTHGTLYRWEFARAGRSFAVSVGAGATSSGSEGGLIVNDVELAIAAAIDGAGIAYVFADQAKEAIVAGRLVQVLEAWCPPFPGLHLYYANHRQLAPAPRAFIEFVRAAVKSKPSQRRRTK